MKRTRLAPCALTLALALVLAGPAWADLITFPGVLLGANEGCSPRPKLGERRRVR